MRRLVFGFLSVATLCLFACRSSQNIEEFSGVGGGIGDDICALMLALDVYVVDKNGDPIADAEVWELTRPVSDPPHAWRAGITDEGGRLHTLDCSMGSIEFSRWSPDDDPVVVDLMIIREGVGARKVTLRPDTNKVLEEGNVLGVSPAEWRLGSPESRLPHRPR